MKHIQWFSAWTGTCMYQKLFQVLYKILYQFRDIHILSNHRRYQLTIKINICMVQLKKRLSFWFIMSFHLRRRWHTKDGPFWKQRERPPYGAKNTQEYDEQHGRWWWQKKDRDQIWSDAIRQAFEESIRIARDWQFVLLVSLGTCQFFYEDQNPPWIILK